MMACAYTAGFIGVPAAGLLARVLVTLRPLNVAGWRWLFVAGSLGGVIVWSLRRLLPESPRWLESAREERLPFQALLDGRSRRRPFMLSVFRICHTVGSYGFAPIFPLLLAPT